jgi:hypothetical protein
LRFLGMVVKLNQFRKQNAFTMSVFVYEAILPSGESEVGTLPESCASLKEALDTLDAHDYEQVTVKKIKKEVYDQLCDFRSRKADSLEAVATF